MINLPLENDYTLLALLLSPSIDDETISTIKSAVKKEQIIWINLLKVAGTQRCAPLLYVRLNQHNLFDALPKPVQHLVTSAYHKNLQRNKTLKKSLIQLLKEFEEQHIESLLLKGAATFCDNLYDDPGARVMGDLDILVHTNNIEACKAILSGLGYIEIPDPGMTLDGLATDVRHHQIPAYQHPTSGVIIEIHFNVSYGQAGRVVPTEQAWTNRIETELNGYKTSVLSTQDRLLLNTAHALLPKREFIRGDIALLQLAEFSILVSKNENSISWSDWAKAAKSNHLEIAFMTYLLMSHKLMNTPWPFNFTVPKSATNNCMRIQTTANEKSILTKLKQNSYYYLRLPAWVWSNVCYAPGAKNLMSRVILLSRVIFRSRSWSKI